MALNLDHIHRLPGQRVSDGLYFPERLTPETLERIKTFPFRHDDVLIASYPKSGTVWISQIVWSILHSDEMELNFTHKLSDRVSYMELSKTPGKIGMDLAENDASPRTFITHAPFRYLRPHYQGCLNSPKMIYIVRHIKDVIVSYYNFYRMAEFFGYFKGTYDDFFELFRHRKLVYGDWFNHLKEFLGELDNPNILLVRYEDLKADLPGEVRSISNFLGKKLSLDIITTIARDARFDVMKNNPMVNKLDNPTMDASISPFFRKGIVGDGDQYLSPSQHQYLHYMYNEVFTKEEKSYLQYF